MTAMMTALIAVILECFVFAIALQLAALVIELGPSQPAVHHRHRRRCIRCGRWFDAPDSALCEFCAVAAVYEHAERVSRLLVPDAAIVRAYN